MAIQSVPPLQLLPVCDPQGNPLSEDEAVEAILTATEHMPRYCRFVSDDAETMRLLDQLGPAFWDQLEAERRARNYRLWTMGLPQTCPARISKRPASKQAGGIHQAKAFGPALNKAAVNHQAAPAGGVRRRISKKCSMRPLRGNPSVDHGHLEEGEAEPGDPPFMILRMRPRSGSSFSASSQMALAN